MTRINPENSEEVGNWIRLLISSNRVEEFYKSRYWTRLRKEILQEYKCECQRCKSKGFYTKATTVHHEQYLRKYPMLGLSKTYEFKGKIYRQLTPLCDKCHKEIHNQHYRKKKKPLTIERW